MPRKMSYSEMRASGLCTRCGRENPTPDRCLCPDCRKKKNEARRSNYSYWKRIKICVRCGKNKAEPGKVFCYECAGKEQDEYYKKEKTDIERERERDRKRKLRSQRKESGLCPKCGKYPSISGGTCKKCRAYMRMYRDSHRNGLPRSEWRSYGICYNCGKNKAITGKGVCQSCYNVRMEAIKPMLENRNNSYFKSLNNLVFSGRK